MSRAASQIRRFAVVIVFVLSVLFALTGESRAADLSRREMVRRSPLILSVRVTRVDHLYRRVQAYGQLARFAVTYRFHAILRRYIRADAPTRVLLSGAGQLKFERPSGILNGPQVAGTRFSVGFPVRSLRPGATILVYVPRLPTPRHAAVVSLPFAALDYESKTQRVVTLLGELMAPALRQLRQTSSRCKTLWTYAFRGLCRTAAQITRTLTCPYGGHPYAWRVGAELFAGCARADGTPHGLNYMWHANGELKRRVTLLNGRLHGPAIEWGPRGRLAKQIYYERGVLNGLWTSFYPSQKRKLSGAMSDGLPHGRWQQWGPDGALLGQYTISRGSGTVTRWHANGHKAQQWQLSAGTRHGKFRRWTAAGQLILSGRYLNGKRHGWWHVRDAGHRVIGQCYGHGRLRWASEDRQTLKTLPCQ